jgi:hypothetical protein
MRRVVLFFALAVTAALIVPVASATRPIREFVPAEDFALDGICPFTVAVEIMANKEYSTTFNDGRVLITGTLKLRLTNASTGASLLVNASGPGLFTFKDDGSLRLRARGNWFFFFLPGELGPGEPGRAFLNSGVVVLNAGPDGIDIVRQTGQMTDVCAALSS